KLGDSQESLPSSGRRFDQNVTKFPPLWRRFDAQEAGKMCNSYEKTVSRQGVSCEIGDFMFIGKTVSVDGVCFSKYAVAPTEYDSQRVEKTFEGYNERSHALPFLCNDSSRLL